MLHYRSSLLILQQFLRGFAHVLWSTELADDYTSGLCPQVGRVPVALILGLGDIYANLETALDLVKDA